MKRIKDLFLLGQLLLLITSCNIEKEESTGEKSHTLIDVNEINTYAFLGNSITHDGRYHSYFELFLLTRYPDVDFKFVNAGVSGDQAGIALNRLQDDLLVHQPDVVMVMFGMNDIGRNLYGRENLELDSMQVKQKRNLSNYATNLDSVTKTIVNCGAELVLFTPSVYEQNAENLAAPNMYGCNDALEECGFTVKEIQKHYNTYLVDHFSVMDSLNTLLQNDNPDTTIVGPDRVHPQDIGHFIMAFNIIEQLGYSPLVASVEIDVPEKMATGANAKIDQLIVDDDMLKFKYNPNALPFPIQNFPDASALIDFNKELNREVFTISGLPAGNYKLTINSTEISVFSAELLQNGINLSDYVTPQQTYASEIAQLVEDKRQIISNKLRNIAFIEYFYAPEVMKETDFIEATKIVRGRLQQDYGKSYYDYLEGQVNLYIEVKNELPELNQKIDSLNQKINHLRKSMPEFEIVLVKHFSNKTHDHE